MLLCRVELGLRSASVHWAFRYDVGGKAHDLGLLPEASDPPLRNPGAESELAASVPEGTWRATGPAGTPELRPCFLTGRALIDFVGTTLPALQAADDVLVELSGDVPEFREATDAPTVTLKVTDAELGDWFDLGVEITVGDESVPFAPLVHRAVRRRRPPAARLGHLVRARPSRTRPAARPDRRGTRPGRRRRRHVPAASRARRACGRNSSRSASSPSSRPRGRRPSGRCSTSTRCPETPVPDRAARPTCVPTSSPGSAGCRSCGATRLGGVLADEMGLGKTLQALALAQSALRGRRAGRPHAGRGADVGDRHLGSPRRPGSRRS